MKRNGALVLLVYMLMAMVGCAVIPIDEQFISTAGRVELRQNGECEETILFHEEADFQTVAGELSPDSIVVLNWNIYKEQGHDWRGDLEKLSRENDLLLLQEVSLQDDIKQLFQHLDLYWNFNSAFKYRGRETGVLLASRVAPLYSCGLREEEPLLGLPKTAIVSGFSIRGTDRVLLVVNVHGINLTLGSNVYRKQFASIGSLLREHDGPILLAGDFNNWNSERISVISGLVDELGLTVLPFENDQRVRFFGDPVDHIMYRGLEPFRHVVYPVESSDHNPIIVEFRLARYNKTDKDVK